MNESSLKRLMRLAQKTGDVLIVTDPDGHEPLVLMSVDRYEDLRLGPDACCEEGDWIEEDEMSEDSGVGTDEGEDFEQFLMRKESEERIPSINVFEEEQDEEAEFAERIGPIPEEPEVAPLQEEKREQSQPKNEGEEQFYLEPIE